MSKFSLHNQLVEILFQGNRRFDEVNVVCSFFYMRRLVEFTNSQLAYAAA